MPGERAENARRLRRIARAAGWQLSRKVASLVSIEVAEKKFKAYPLQNRRHERPCGCRQK